MSVGIIIHTADPEKVSKQVTSYRAFFRYNYNNEADMIVDTPTLKQLFKEVSSHLRNAYDDDIVTVEAHRTIKGHISGLVFTAKRDHLGNIFFVDNLPYGKHVAYVREGGQQ